MTRRRDLEVALTFSADGDELVATTRVSTAELAKLGDEAERTGQQAGRAGDQIDTMGRQSRQAGGNARALWDNVMGLKGAIIGLTGAVGGLSLGRFTGDVIGVASETENLEVRLRVLLGSVEEGNRLLGNMQHLASRLPVRISTKNNTTPVPSLWFIATWTDNLLRGRCRVMRQRGKCNRRTRHPKCLKRCAGARHEFRRTANFHIGRSHTQGSVTFNHECDICRHK